MTSLSHGPHGTEWDMGQNVGLYSHHSFHEMSRSARDNLVRILQHAYSGEIAAAYAYHGHWRSLRTSGEKERIKQIEAEEWDHRRRVGEWLEKLDAAPRPT